VPQIHQCQKCWIGKYNLLHQFKEGNFPDVSFALGTNQALFLRVFIHADSSTQRNFIVFAFQEQEPNSACQQTEFLICQFDPRTRSEESLNTFKASFKQAVHVPLILSVLKHNSNSLQQH
jgi:hypothetical protein